MIIPSLASGMAKALIFVQLSGCPMAPPPKITLNLYAQKPTYNDSLSVAQLTERFGNSTSYNNFAYTDLKIAGLTDAHFGHRYKIVPSVIREGDYACLGVQEVVVDIFYSAEIYIPSEYQPGGCRYETTIKHEHGHVTTALDTIREFGARFESELKRAVEEMGPQGPHVDAKEVLDDQVQSISEQIGDTEQAVFTEMMEANQQRQYAIDDPKVLADTWKVCR